MNFTSVVNDTVNVSDLSAPQARVPVLLSANTDLNALGLGSVAGSNMYYITNAPLQLTFPANYSAYDGRVLHVLSYNGAVTVPASSSTSGVVTRLDTGGAPINGGTLLAAAGNWATLVCDGVSGWLVSMLG